MSNSFIKGALESFSPIIDWIGDHKKIVIPVAATVCVLIVSLTGFSLFRKLTKSPVPELLQANFGESASNIASAQSFYVSAIIRDGQDKFLKIEAEDRKDSDTDHIKAAYSASKTIVQSTISAEVTELETETATQANSEENGNTPEEAVEEQEIIPGTEIQEEVSEEAPAENPEIPAENSEEIAEEPANPEAENNEVSENPESGKIPGTVTQGNGSEEAVENDFYTSGKLNSSNLNWELYVTTIDLKYGVYQRIDKEPWTLTKKSKTISEDDVRTNYIEKNNEVSFEIVDDNIISDVKYEYDKSSKEYIVTGKTNYLIALAMMGNLRQILYECPLYSYTDLFFNEYNTKIPVDVKMVFDKTTKQLKQIDMSVDEDMLQKCIIAYNSDKKDLNKINISKITFSIENTSFDPSDIYVPIEIERDAVVIK